MCQCRRLTSTPRCSECNQNVLVTTNLLAKCRIRQVSHRRGLLQLLLGLDASLLGDEVGQALQIPAAAVVDGFIALAIEELEGGESLDTESTAKFLLCIGVNLCDLDVLGECEGAGEVLVDGGEVLAVAAPWCKELDKCWLAGLEDDAVEVIWDEVEDRGLGSYNGCQAGEHEALNEDHYCWEMVVFWESFGDALISVDSCSKERPGRHSSNRIAWL